MIAQVFVFSYLHYWDVQGFSGAVLSWPWKVPHIPQGGGCLLCNWLSSSQGTTPMWVGALGLWACEFLVLLSCNQRLPAVLYSVWEVSQLPPLGLLQCVREDCGQGCGEVVHPWFLLLGLATVSTSHSGGNVPSAHLVLFGCP